MYVYKTDIATLGSMHPSRFDAFANALQMRQDMKDATYGVVCQSEQMLTGVLPVIVSAEGEHTVLGMYTRRPAPHAEVCLEMLQLVVSELGGASAYALLPLTANGEDPASAEVFRGCCFLSGERTDKHIVLEYNVKPRII